MPETIEYAPRPRGRLALAALIVIVLALAATLWKIHTAASTYAARIATLEQKTGELSKRLDALQAGAKPLPPAVASTTDITPDAQAKLKMLEDKVNTFSTQQNSLMQNLLETGNVRGSVAELTGKFKSLDAAQQAMEVRTRNLVMRLNSFYRLNDAVRSGKPYADELAQMEELAAGEETLRAQLEKLEPYADTGILPPWQLREEFSAAAREALAPKAGNDAKFTDKMMANLKRLVVVRKIGAPADETGPKAAIARAEAHMDHQEVEAALAEIEDLPEPDRGPFAVWITMAHFVIGAPATLLAVQNQIVEDIYITANLPATPPK